MSKPSRRPSREARKQRLRQQRKLRRHQRGQGLEPPRSPTLPNAKSEWQSVEEETAERQQVVIEHMRVLRRQLPTLLKRLAKIPDPRNPKKIRHQLTSVLVFGLLSFVFQMASRREANRTMSRPVFWENLQLLVPELKSLPHHDTLYRLLCRIEVAQIEAAHVELVRRLIRKKTFRRHLIEQCYPVAVDGTQKLVRDLAWTDEALQRQVGAAEQPRQQYYVYVLEACLVLGNGMVLPLMSEFLGLPEGASQTLKQDCELKAFQRLAARLKEQFPRLRILLLLDGLYANGPLIQSCRDYRWQFMIVLKDTCLLSVWQEARGLRQLQTDNRLCQPWGERRQRFWWVNGIEYTYGRHDRRQLELHVVVCEETWQQVDAEARVQTRRSRHAWLSSQPLSRDNLHERCNLAARHRWDIEANILVEKHQGYCYEHAFAYDWQALRGYHYLMRLGHFLNVLARYCQRLQPYVAAWGVRGLLSLVRETVANPWLDPVTVRDRLAQRCQIRLL